MKNLLESQMSFFQSKMSKCDKHISLEDYINMVKLGVNKDTIEKARKGLELDKADNKKAKNGGLLKERYNKEKGKLPLVLGSMTSLVGKSHAIANKIELNGFMVIDIDEDVDEDLIEELKEDQYTYILHRSVGGVGVCIFVQINKRSFAVCFNELAEYYKEKYDVIIDKSCKNENRLRFISYDPYLFLNTSAKKFRNVKRKEQVVPVVKDFVFLESDFTEIVNNIVSRRVSLCDSYNEYMQIGYAIASKFGWAGFSYFDAIASCSSGYDAKKIEKHYRNFCKSDESGSNTKATIATVYYYAKEAGIALYSDRTKQIVRTASISKQGKASGNTLEGVNEVLDVKGIKPTKEEKALIKHIWDNKVNYCKSVNEDDEYIDQLVDYVKEKYNPVFNSLKQDIYLDNKKQITTRDLNDIYISCTSFFSDQKVTFGDIQAVMNSNEMESYDPIKEFFDVEIEAIEEGYIDRYIDFVEEDDEELREYNRWAFKKWVVGTVHNWISEYDETEVSPLTIVFVGKGNTGKTKFQRQLRIQSLYDNFLEERIKADDKDSLLKMAQYLFISDEEFGGIATKDIKAFKDLSNKTHVNVRRPFDRRAESIRRRAGLIGNSNDMDILRDPTGNRRILPVAVKSTKYEFWKEFSSDLVWLEAYKLLKNGFNWRVERNEQEYLDKMTRKYKPVNDISEIFFSDYSPVPTSEHSVRVGVQLGDVNKYFTNMNIKTNTHTRKEIFTERDMVYKKRRIGGLNIDCYELYIKSNEIGNLKFRASDEDRNGLPF